MESVPQIWRKHVYGWRADYMLYLDWIINYCSRINCIWNHQNYTIYSLQLMQALCYQSNGVTAENKQLSLFTSWYMYILPIHYGSGWLPHMHILYLPWVLLTSCPLWIELTSVLMEHHRHYIWMGWLGVVDTHTTLISSAHMYAPLSHWTSLTKHKFKGKIILNFKMTIAQ